MEDVVDDEVDDGDELMMLLMMISNDCEGQSRCMSWCGIGRSALGRIRVRVYGSNG